MEKWKRFERLNAGLTALQMKGAQVNWDDDINGYQIDVSVRFEHGPYRYLHIVECRDQNRAATRDQIAAFAMKVRKTKANKGVFISATGFQTGALALAHEEGIDTFVLQELPSDWADTILVTPPTPFIAVRTMAVHPRGMAAAQWLQIPEEVGPQFHYNARFVSRRGLVRTVNEAFEPSLPPDWPDRKGRWALMIRLEGDWELRFPASPSMPVDGLYVELETIPKDFTFKAFLPPEMRPSELTLTDALNDRSEPAVPTNDVPFGLDTEILQGNYYEDAAGRQYYCEAVHQDEVEFVLLASVQHGKQFFSHFSQTHENVRGFYAPITRQDDLDRAQAAHAEWRRAKERGLMRRDCIVDLKRGAVFFPSKVVRGA